MQCEGVGLNWVDDLQAFCAAHVTDEEFDKAKENLTLAAEQDPTNEILWFSLGSVLDNLGNADEAIAAYEQDLADARAKANQIGQEARDAAKAEADAERKETEAALEKKLADAESRIASIKSDAMKEVGTIAEHTAMALVEQLVGKATKSEIAQAVKAVNG